MAKKGQERRAWEVDFTDVPLSREEIEKCKKWDADYSHTIKSLDNALFKGSKVSVAYNVTTGSYICTVTAPTPDDNGHKKCFSSHAPEFMDSMKLAAYKIETVLDGNILNVYGVSEVADAWR